MRRTTTAGFPDTLQVVHHPSEPGDPELIEPELIERPDGDDQGLAGPDPEAALNGLLAQFDAERRRRHSVWAGKGLIGGLAVALLAVWLLRPPLAGGDENRARTRFPALTTAGLLDGGSARQADAALRDRLALRQYVVRAVGQTARDHDTSLNPQVLMGPTGVPFLTDDFTLPCQDTFDPAAVDTGLRQLRALGASTGKTITVAIAPDKSSILTGELGARGTALMACSNQVRQSTEATWGDSPTAPVLTTWTQLAAEQKARPGTVFQRGDSHWTSQGAMVWSHALIGRLIAQGEAPEALRDAPEADATEVPGQPVDSDLYALMGITRSETLPVWQVVRPGVKVTAKSLPSPSGHGIARFHAVARHHAPLITGRTLVINDSFISRAEGELAPYFSDLEVLHWADFLTDVQSGTLPPFDRIILETVQRGWPQRAGYLADGQPVHDALAAALSEMGGGDRAGGTAGEVRRGTAPESVRGS